MRKELQKRNYSWKRKKKKNKNIKDFQEKLTCKYIFFYINRIESYQREWIKVWNTVLQSPNIHINIYVCTAQYHVHVKVDEMIYNIIEFWCVAFSWRSKHTKKILHNRKLDELGKKNLRKQNIVLFNIKSAGNTKF